METIATPEVKLPAVKELPELVTLLIARVTALEAKVTELSKPAQKQAASTRTMTDDDARNILFGELATASHKDAAEKLGLSYGQIYSCRLEFTFKAIHKEMRDAGKKNLWVK